MLVNRLLGFKDLLHAQLCYQLFITPIPLPLEKQYREFGRKACEFFLEHRTKILNSDVPRHHVIHHFASKKPEAKKVLITHGWMSRSAYMVRLIHCLHEQGFDIYALDFPAHGEAKGIQLPWTDAVTILKQVLNNLGPFYSVIGHSFGGSMLLNTLNLASQFKEWQIDAIPERLVLMASPTRMLTPVGKLARRYKMSSKGFQCLKKVFSQYAITDLKNLDYRNYSSSDQTSILCIHGENDETIMPSESIIFCQHHANATLALLPDADHVSILMDERVEKAISQFLF